MRPFYGDIEPTITLHATGDDNATVPFAIEPMEGASAFWVVPQFELALDAS